MKSINHILSVTTLSLIFSASSQAVTPFTESFSASSLNTSRWLLTNERGKLTQSSGRLNFSTTATTGETESFIILRGIEPTYNENWEVLATVVNKSTKKDTWLGLAILNAVDEMDAVGFELARSGANKWVFGDYDTNDVDTAGVSKAISVEKIYLRYRFNKSDKVITSWYRTSTLAAWTKFSTFSTTGSTLTNRRGNWQMTSTSRFKVAIYGGSYDSSVVSGAMYVDDFIIRNY